MHPHRKEPIVELDDAAVVPRGLVIGLSDGAGQPLTVGCHPCGVQVEVTMDRAGVAAAHDLMVRHRDCG